MERSEGHLSKPWGRALGLEAEMTQLGLKGGVEFRGKKGSRMFQQRECL